MIVQGLFKLHEEEKMNEFINKYLEKGFSIVSQQTLDDTKTISIKMYREEDDLQMELDPLPYKCDGEYHPTKGTPYAAGIDLYNNDRKIVLEKGGKAYVSTKTAFEIPDGWMGLVVPRSGLGSKGLRLSNTVGIIDSDYRGHVMAVLIYEGDEPLTLDVGERFCQMIVVPHLNVELLPKEKLNETERGDGGFGSTGEK